jgi:hypothetical protein
MEFTEAATPKSPRILGQYENSRSDRFAEAPIIGRSNQSTRVSDFFCTPYFLRKNRNPAMPDIITSDESQELAQLPADLLQKTHLTRNSSVDTKQRLPSPLYSFRQF